MIQIQNLNFNYEENYIFNNFNLIIDDNKWVTLLGINNSGKSTLTRILLGFLPFNGKISINDMELTKKNIKKIRTKAYCITTGFEKQFIYNTLYENIKFSLKNRGLMPIEIKSRITEILNYVDIRNILNVNINTLSVGQKQLISIAYVIAMHPTLIILDESLEMLDEITRKNILNSILQLKQKYGITILNITHNIEESLYGDDIIIMNKGAIVLYDKKENVYLKDKVLKSNGYSLPFCIEVSEKLKYYGLVDKPYYKIDDLVGDLWK